MKTVGVGCATLALAILMCLAAGPAAAREPTVDDVIDRYATARNRRDLSGLLSLFADDAAVTESNGRTYVKRSDLRRMLQQGMYRGESVSIANRHQVGHFVSWEEIVRYGTSGLIVRTRAVIRDGRIKALAYGEGSLPHTTSEMPPVREELPAVLGSSCVVLFMTGALLLLIALSGCRRHSNDSFGNGLLLRDLRRWTESRRHCTHHVG